MKSFITFFCFLLFLSCEAEDATIPDDEILATELELYPKEVYANNEPGLPHLELILQTSKDYPCYNYAINFSQSFEKGELTILLKEISKPNICLTAFGPAIGAVELPESTRELRIVRGNQTDVFSISITNDRVEIVPQTIRFTNLLYPITFRYPENSFALVCGTSLERTEVCDHFLQNLEEIPSLSPYIFPENGRVPFPVSSSGNWNNTSSRYFIYENDAAVEEAVERLKIFTHEYLNKGDGNSLSITTWDNQNYYSYQLLE